MAVIESGASTTLLTVEANQLAARVTQRPLDIGALGSYSLAMDNGLTVMPAGAQTNAEFFQFRWAHATSKCVLRSIKVDLGSVIAFAAGKLVVSATRVSSFTAVGSGTGSTNPTLASGHGKKVAGHATSLIPNADIVMAGTAMLSAGTKTIEGSHFASIASSVPTTIGPIVNNQYLWQRDSGDEWPFVFGQNEGFILRLTCPATGTYYLGVDVEWAEVTAY